MLLLHRGIQAIKIRELGDIPLNRGHVLADLSHCCIQFALTATGDVDVGALCDEAPGRGQADTAAATRDDRDFSFKLCHDFSPLESISSRKGPKAVVWTIPSHRRAHVLSGTTIS